MHPQKVSAAEKLCVCQCQVLLCDLETEKKETADVFEPAEMLLLTLRDFGIRGSFGFK